MSDLDLGSYLPSGEFLYRQPIRAYEPGSNARLGPSNLLRYCELVANAASAASGFGENWYLDQGDVWVIFRQTLELSTPIGVGDEIDLRTWVRSHSRVSALRDYLFTRVGDGAVVARTTTTWAYVDRETQSPKRVPADVLEKIPTTDRVALPKRLSWGTPPDTSVFTARMELRARSYEADRLQHINNCIYADWLTEATHLARLEWQRTADPRLAQLAAREWLPRRFELHYQRSALVGAQIVVTTKAERLGSRGLILSHAIAPRDDEATPYVSATTTYLTES